MWTDKEISDFQIMNDKALAEINATLRPDENLMGGKVGIFAFGQAGDLATCMSVLKYRNEIFPGKKIIWFANFPNADMLRYAPISEVRPWPWAGNGLPIGTPDYWPMLCNGMNRLNTELSKQFEGTADLIDGYFPCPFMLSVEKRHGVDYPNCSRKVFNVPDDWPWHPVLNFSDEERQEADKFINELGGSKKIIIESFAGSSQSKFDESMFVKTIELCSEMWKDCVFIFASHKFIRGNEQFPNYLLARADTTSCAKFTVRQCALIAEKCDLMISVSSGITVACSAWGVRQPKTIQFCGSWVCSTKTLSKTTRFELVTADDKLFENAKNEFYEKLKLLLNE